MVLFIKSSGLRIMLSGEQFLRPLYRSAVQILVCGHSSLERVMVDSSIRVCFIGTSLVPIHLPRMVFLIGRKTLSSTASGGGKVVSTGFT
jgi:hypothetical protein